jgi:uncharacterized membrane protein
MAGQKARAASGRAKSGGSTARNGRSSQATTPARAGKNGRANAGQSGPGQNGGRAAARLAEPAIVTTADERFSVPAWLQWTSLVLSLAGLGVSIYLTIAHYTSTSILTCSAKGFVDCAKVTTSAQSMVFGVFPVAVLGLAFYVFMTAVNSPWGWRLRTPLVWWTRLGSAVIGIGFVLYLVYAEVIQIGNICLWCTSVHVITFLLFGLLVFAGTMNSGSAARQSR